NHGMSYSRLIAGLRTAGVEVDRKVLADLAVRDDATFAALVEVARDALSGPSAAASATAGRGSGPTERARLPARGRTAAAAPHQPPQCPPGRGTLRRRGRQAA